jgi:hypothetical protein
LAKEIERIGNLPVGFHTHWQSARSEIRAAKKTMLGGRPAYACPYCRGEKKDCRVCYGHGFVATASYESAPPELKVIKRAGKDGAA